MLVPLVVPFAVIVTDEGVHEPALAVRAIEIEMPLLGSAFPYGSLPRVSVSFDVIRPCLTVLGGQAENESRTLAALIWNPVELPLVVASAAVSVVDAAALKSVMVAVPTPLAKLTVVGYVGALPAGEFAGPLKVIALFPE